MGNATGDPSRRDMPDGTPSAMVRIAVTGRYFDISKKSFEDRKTEFITVYARRNLARNLMASVRKGQPLVVTGRLSSSEWTDSEDVRHVQLVMQAEALGHDLTYGTAVFTKPLRTQDLPDVDFQTGEVLSPSPGIGGSSLEIVDGEAGDDDALTAAAPLGGSLATAS
ncbi:single-stranded DNA-binding protein [Brachybacterium sp. DNPG3]